MEKTKLSVIDTLRLILFAYNNVLRENIKGNNTFKFDVLVEINMFTGVCHYCNKNNLLLPKYIVSRNVKHIASNGIDYWFATPYELFLKDEDVMEGVIQRIVILEKELKHHKKWRFLAKYIHP
jgi:adenine-specific DNA methylase